MQMKWIGLGKYRKSPTLAKNPVYLMYLRLKNSSDIQ